MIIVTDKGFRPIDALPDEQAMHLAADADIAALGGKLAEVELITVAFDNFADGRGFSIALNLRRAGFSGPLYARGHVIPDQYAHARRCGFDGVAISPDQAARMGEEQWLAQVGHIDNTYQNRLQQAAHAA